MNYHAVAPRNVNNEYSELRKSVESIKKELQQLMSDKKVQAEKQIAPPAIILPMSRDEKKKLKNDIHHLPGEHLAAVVKIIQQKMPNLRDDDDEIVIDIDALDNSTLRDIEQYIQKVKKKKSSRRNSSANIRSSVGGVVGGSNNQYDKLEQAKKSEEVTFQKMEDVQRRLAELSSKSAARNGIKVNTSFSLANQDLKLETSYSHPDEGDRLGSSSGESESESGSSESESESDSGSESESGSDSHSDAEKK
jgi:hypothetical protein